MPYTAENPLPLSEDFYTHWLRTLNGNENAPRTVEEFATRVSKALSAAAAAASLLSARNRETRFEVRLATDKRFAKLLSDSLGLSAVGTAAETEPVSSRTELSKAHGRPRSAGHTRVAAFAVDPGAEARSEPVHEFRRDESLEEIRRWRTVASELRGALLQSIAQAMREHEQERFQLPYGRLVLKPKDSVALVGDAAPWRRPPPKSKSVLHEMENNGDD